jgi:hypothetical protein
VLVARTGNQGRGYPAVRGGLKARGFGDLPNELELMRAQFYCKEHVEIGERFARFAFVSRLNSSVLGQSITDTRDSAKTRRCCIRPESVCSGSKSLCDTLV